MYYVILKNLKKPDEIITMSEGYTLEASAQDHRKAIRNALGGKRWTVDRRPGLDTLDHLALTVVKRPEDNA